DLSNMSVQKLGPGQTLAETFVYEMTDSQAANQSASLTVTINGKDDGIVITGIGATGGDIAVREDDLPTGSGPDAGGLSKSGSFTIEALDGIRTVAIGGITLTAAQLTTAATFPVTLATGHGTLSLTGYSGDDQGGTVSYTYTLTSAVDNDSEAGAGDDLYVDKIDVTVTDTDNDTGSTSINAGIADDAPVAQAIAVDGGVQPIDTNLLIILDTSGSMNDPSGMHDLSRMRAAVAGIHELLDQYDSMGNVMVNIAYFYDTAQVQNHGNLGGVWLTVDQAKAFLGNLQAAGWTNYDAALAAAMAAYDNPGKLADAQNVAYFMSDGYPNYNNDNVDTLGTSPAVDGPGSNPFDDPDDGIQPAERALWQNFLKANDIDAYSIGMGSDVGHTALDPIGYDGLSETIRPAIEVHDMNDLSSVLTSTVRYTTSGSLLAGGSLGADGGYVRAIQYAGATFVFDGTSVTASGAAGVVWQFDAQSHRLTLTTDGGSLGVDMDTGAYTYRHSDPAVLEETFTYTLIDHDGDTAGNTLTFNFANADHAPIVRDDAILLATDDYAAPVTVPDAWLLWNDSDGNGDLIAITQVTEALSHANGEVLDSLDGNGAGAFGYTGTTTAGSTQSDTALVGVRATDAQTLNGDGLDNILVGDDSFETLGGFEGNDVLVGRAGNDQLDGGSGRDWLLGGAGDDLLVGGMGSDLFAWRLADPGTAGTPAADTVADFDPAGGDILDLRDLLVGEHHGANDIGNLEAYLDIVTDAGGNTVIRVSSTGGFANGLYSAGAEDQRITLKDVDLYAQYGVAPGQDADLIKTMIQQGQLAVD
ncbi:MAG: type I secretion C-terminal target domain-containing protein, partial [Thiobacillus sp.]|nr:type I secretion C-terminal target domain-containing protein [Thiobacillus sp.]